MRSEDLKFFKGRYVLLTQSDNFKFYLFVSDVNENTLFGEDHKSRLHCIAVEQVLSCRELSDREKARFKNGK